MTTKNLLSTHFILELLSKAGAKRGTDIFGIKSKSFPKKYMKQVKSKSITLRKWEITLSAYTLATDTKQEFTVGTP